MVEQRSSRQDSNSSPQFRSTRGRGRGRGGATKPTATATATTTTTTTTTTTKSPADPAATAQSSPPPLLPSHKSTPSRDVNKEERVRIRGVLNGLSSSQTAPLKPKVSKHGPAPSPQTLALKTLQHLPIPLLVVSHRSKTVVLANEAMAQMMDKKPTSTLSNGQSPKTTNGCSMFAPEQMLGKNLNELNFVIMENSGPVWVAWDTVLDSVMDDLRSGKLKSYPTSVMNVRYPYPDTPSAEDCLQAQMTIAVWEDAGETYFTLTFAPQTPSSVRVNTEDEECHTQMDGPGIGEIGPAPSFAKKIAVLKDALLDAMDLPVYAVWEDGSIAIQNRAGRDLSNPPNGPVDEAIHANNNPPFNPVDLMSNFRAFTEDFKRELPHEEYPIFKLCQNKKSFSSEKVGMLSRSGRKMVFQVDGKAVHDSAGTFIAGLVWLRDVTEMQKKLTHEEQQNELRFRTICDCMPQMIWTTTPEGDHDYFSQRWYDYTGMTSEQCLGSHWRSGFHPDDIEGIYEEWRRCLKSGEPYTVEYRCRRYDGEYRWMLGRALPLHCPETGRIVKWCGTTTDIHDMVEARLSERATREHLLQALTHARITLWATDEQRRVTLLEGGIIWKTRDDPLYYYGKDVKDIIGEKESEKENDHYKRFLDPVDPLLRGEMQEGFSEAELGGHWFRTKYVPIMGKKGPAGVDDPNYVAGVIGLSMDVTQMHATEMELQERERQNRVLQANESAAKEASKLKSEFLASMSHEIRTPIAGVVGMCEILSDTKLTEQQREYAEGIQRSANALLTVINDILDISKVESGRMDIEEVQFNLSLVIKDVVKMMSFDAERKGLKFITDKIMFTGTDDMKVMGDPGRIRQILMNLLSNSMKFTHDGFVELSASVEPECDEDSETITINFVVQDSGIGIAEEDQRKLFQPFTQADSSTARRFGGTGLGLTICRNLVDLMGGKIGLSSDIGTGTKAFFSIPFKKPQYSNREDSLHDIDQLPERLQCDMSVSCRSSDTGIGTPPESPLDPASDGLHRRASQSEPLLKRLSRSCMAGADSELLKNPQERRKRHVLVVEDNEINQQIAIQMVKKLNFTVSAVNNGKEALDFVARATTLPPSYDETSKAPPSARRPDIILMDVQMPELDGYSATRAIRAGKLPLPLPLPSPSSSAGDLLRPKSPRLALARQKARDYLASVPIVAMTASAIQGDREKCRDAGMDDYLAKPVRGGMLEKMLVKWCSASRSRAGSSADEAAVEDAPLDAPAPAPAPLPSPPAVKALDAIAERGGPAEVGRGTSGSRSSEETTPKAALPTPPVNGVSRLL
ncbi:hypothetical protein EDC01DRAFT_28541 [Geopyxis carbonaria]|nr:hypothetical protein EDC01DRAFT_28541 [Geopyxis carbonaria]